jgi:signal transduction histidine kinase
VTSDAVTLGMAAFAIGVDAATIAAMLLFDARNRRVRWYVVFSAVLGAWLVALLLSRAGAASVLVRALYSISGHLVSVAFLLFALVIRYDTSRRVLAVVATASLPLLPFTAGISPWHVPLVDSVYQTIAWGTSAWLVWRTQQLAPRIATGTAAVGQMRTVLVALLLAIVAIVMSVLMVQPSGTIVLIPLVASIAQLLVLIGTVRFQLYSFDARVERTAGLAGQAAERERLAVVGELAATVAHEIRNPLTGVRSLAQRLAQEPVDEERRRRYAQLIVDEVLRVDGIVSNLLAIARPSPTDRESVETTSLVELFDDLELLVADRAERQGVALAFAAAEAEVSVWRAPLAQVLLNLLLNAIAHTPRGGRVEMSSWTDDEDLVIGVRDQGPGIPVDERERVFEPFYTGTGGSGLGLAVVRRVSEERGWRVDVTDARGGGAELRITVPARAAGATSAPTSTAQA